ncbi:6181_t:CDS:1, partial [Entrophospora sp. SA101]
DGIEDSGKDVGHYSTNTTKFYEFGKKLVSRLYMSSLSYEKVLEL